MRRFICLVTFGVGALLLTPSAPGVADVPGDPTPPVVTPMITGTLGSNGWYTTTTTVNWSIVDPESVILSTTGCNARTLSTDTVGAQLTCSAESDGGTTTVAKTFNVDKTAPAATATPSRGADGNGWYNQPLTVTFAATDATSGVASCSAAKSYGGPDSASAPVNGACTDKAGNSGAASFTVKYDATGPQTTASAGRTADANGWYNQSLAVSFSGTDAMSGIDSCDAAKTYAGPDTVAASVGGNCRDRAGNSSGGSLTFKYDATGPQVTAAPGRAADANGWYNHALAVTFSATDATSGLGSCDAAKTYAGPDTAATSVAGACRDQAGNSATASLPIKYDATAPSVAGATPSRPADANGWYNHPLSVSFAATDATSGLASCPGPGSYSGPDSVSAVVSGTCLDQAGNGAPASFVVKYDATAPTATASPDGPPGPSGWHTAPVTVSFGGTDATSGLASCSAPSGYSGPDSATAGVSGSCVDQAGNSATATLPVRYDATPPQVTGAIPSRPADANGWFNHPLTVSFQGSDATSAIDACTVASYAGPDATAASVTGSCRDRAGNGSSPASFALKYDSTPPSLEAVTVKAGNRAAMLSWRASPDTDLVQIRRSRGRQAAGSMVFSGSGRRFTDRRLENGTRYRYTVTAYDEARNAATRTVVVRPTTPLIAPPAGARVSSPPRLSWIAVERARYYNVQVYRGRKILSVWPEGTSIQLHRTWRYAGRRYHLTPGRYRWYVWPGYGRRAARNYGRLLGSGSFVVIREGVR